MTSLTNMLLALWALVATAAAALFLFRSRRRSPRVDVQGGIEQLRSIGHLSVYRAFTREIVTETDHSWGDFGRKYLSWILSSRKMAMIFEFEIDFRYDLRDPGFAIEPVDDELVDIRMPPCRCETRIRDIRFYDEQRSRLLPWLLPDLVNGFLGDDFREDDRNRLVRAARSHAESRAMALVRDIQPEVFASARATLESLARGFGIRVAEISFAEGNTMTVSQDVGSRAA
jgi:hypothetical protein